MKIESLLIPAAIVYVGYKLVNNVQITPTLNVNSSLFGGSGSSTPIDWSSVLPKTDWSLFSGYNPAQTYAINRLNTDKFFYDWGLTSNQTMVNDITAVAQTVADQANALFAQLGIPRRVSV